MSKDKINFRAILTDAINDPDYRKDILAYLICEQQNTFERDRFFTAEKFFDKLEDELAKLKLEITTNYEREKRQYNEDLIKAKNNKLMQAVVLPKTTDRFLEIDCAENKREQNEKKCLELEKTISEHSIDNVKTAEGLYLKDLQLLEEELAEASKPIQSPKNKESAIISGKPTADHLIDQNNDKNYTDEALNQFKLLLTEASHDLAPKLISLFYDKKSKQLIYLLHALYNSGLLKQAPDEFFNKADLHSKLKGVFKNVGSKTAFRRHITNIDPTSMQDRNVIREYEAILKIHLASKSS
jgi:hypothetical protein